MRSAAASQIQTWGRCPPFLYKEGTFASPNTLPKTQLPFRLTCHLHLLAKPPLPKSTISEVRHLLRLSLNEIKRQTYHPQRLRRYSQYHIMSTGTAPDNTLNGYLITAALKVLQADPDL
jgi:hypothetical protein